MVFCLSVCMCVSVREYWIPWTRSYRVVSCHLSALEEQTVILTTEPSLQSVTRFLKLVSHSISLSLLSFFLPPCQSLLVLLGGPILSSTHIPKKS